jgi:drug/metabolite transporter (DMT)-like permease
MYRSSRVVATLAAAAIAGVLLWVATYFELKETYGYWAAYGIVAAAGLVVGLAQIRGRTGNPPLMFLLVFLPVLIAAGWVLLAMQPHGNWFRAHTLSWSRDIGIADVVKDLGTWLGVLAFGIGYTLGLVLEPAPVAEPVAEPVARPAARPAMAPGAYDRTATDEPMAAERREVATTGDGRAVMDDERARAAQRAR